MSLNIDIFIFGVKRRICLYLQNPIKNSKRHMFNFVIQVRLGFGFYFSYRISFEPRFEWVVNKMTIVCNIDFEYN